LFTGALGVRALGTWLALGGHASPWVTVPVHVAAALLLCLVLHDCGHHAAGRLTWVNDTMGRIAMPFVSAFASFPAARFLHWEQHRRHGTEHLTPWNVHGPAWQRPLRWMLADLWHAYAYLKRSDERPQHEVAETLALLALVPAACAAVIGTGHGWELLVVYLLPQRIAVALVSWWFDWFPRGQPPEARSYHRVHTRHPSLPFYRYLQAWRADHEPCPGAPAAPACPGEFHALTVASVRKLTDNAVLVGFTVPEDLRPKFRFTPGQHVVLRTVVDGEEVGHPYAICSCPADDELRVAIKQLPGGRLSTYATTALAPGDLLDVRPPSGEFTLVPVPRDARHLVAVAAGIGIAPVLPLLGHTLTTAPRSRATLLYVNRSGADTMFADELSEYTRRFEGRLRVLHFRTDERDPDLHPARAARPFDTIASALAITYERYHSGGLDVGRLRTLLECRLHPAKVDDWFVCAPPDIAGGVRALLAEHDVPDAAVHSEEFHATQPG
jgi:ring-1,2-phenylacetyl-CoA epoxidase subunit PaaE